MGSALTILPDEIGLIGRIVEEPAAFAAIYDHYFARVYNYVRYRVAEAATADDVTAQTFERALASISRYQPEQAPFGAWLFAIARHAVTDYLRAQRRHPMLSLEAVHNQPMPDLEPEQAAIQNESHTRLIAALARLATDERDLIALKFAAGLTNRDIAKVTGLSESNVGIKLFRAMRKLRDKLAQPGGEP